MFYLRNKNNKTSAIFLYKVKKKEGYKLEVKWYPGIIVNVKDWNSTKGRLFERVTIEDCQEINARLDNAEVELKKILSSKDCRLLTQEGVIHDLEKALGIAQKESQEDEITLFQFLDDYCRKKEEIKGYLLVSSYKLTVNKLKKFNKKLDFDDINMSFYDKFVRYLEKEGDSKNYVGRMVSNLKIMLSDAVRLGVTKNEEFRKFHKIYEEVDNVYLSTEEIEKIYNKDLGESKSLNRARDLFIIGCCTGMRCDNYTNIDPDIQVLDSGFIQAIVNKNGPKVLIPMHWMVKEILAKYKGKFPPPMTNQELNRNIKKVCEMVELNEPFIKARTEGGKRIVISDPKWKFITSHTARRSFATNLWLAGADIKTIMDITGHKTTEQFFKYIKSSREDSAKKLADSTFFMKPVVEDEKQSKFDK